MRTGNYHLLTILQQTDGCLHPTINNIVIFSIETDCKQQPKCRFTFLRTYNTFVMELRLNLKILTDTT